MRRARATNLVVPKRRREIERIGVVQDKPLMSATPLDFETVALGGRRGAAQHVAILALRHHFWCHLERLVILVDPHEVTAPKVGVAHEGRTYTIFALTCAELVAMKGGPE